MNRKIIIALFLLIWPSFAGKTWALTVAPGRTQIRLLPGASLKGSLTVTNETSQKVQVEMSQKDWFVLPANEGKTVSQWLKLKGPHYFWLKPGKMRTVDFKATCPADARGELVGMVSFAYQPENPTMVTPVISVSVYVSALGTEVVSGFINDLSIRRVQEKTQVAVGVKSTGNVHLRPTGHIEIMDAGTETVATFPISEGEPAYPAHDRGYFAEDTALQLPVGRYMEKATLTYGPLTMTAAKEFIVKKDGSFEPAKHLRDEYSSSPGDKGNRPS